LPGVFTLDGVRGDDIARLVVSAAEGLELVSSGVEAVAGDRPGFSVFAGKG